MLHCSLCCCVQGLPVQQETCAGGVSAAGRFLSGHESQAGGSEVDPKGEAGPAGLQRTSLCSAAAHRHRLAFIQHIQCMFCLSESLLNLYFSSS